MYIEITPTGTAQVRDALALTPRTAYDVAGTMRWNASGRWDDLPAFQRRMATTEALAHLELLHGRGAVRRLVAVDGLVRYALVSADAHTAAL